jgi:ribulose 1,5-bisphosphate synthetase/thiazole synthase
MSATLFNLTPTDIARATKRGGALPAAVRRIMIVGGGTAGWMGALILARTFIEQGVEITVVESPNVGIIGVDNLLDRSTVNYRDHRKVLANIPPRRMGESLQVYFW